MYFPNVTRVPSRALFLLCVLVSCRGAGCSRAGGLAVGGDHPYVRCLAGDPPSEATHRIGALTLHLAKRELRIDGLRSEVTLAAFSGPAFNPPPTDRTVAQIAAAKPDVILLIGDVGDSAQTAASTLTVLSKLQTPVLVLAGGRDTSQRLAEALAQATPAAADRIIDVTALRAVRLGRDTLVPVAGARDGLYALSAEACGYAEADLDDVATGLADAPKSRRWLLAWEAPSSSGRFGVARAEAGADLGSSPLEKLSQRISAPGGLFAYPSVQVGRASSSAGAHRPSPGLSSPDLQLVVPRLTGLALVRSDGSRAAPGFALLKLDQSGLRLVELRDIPP